MAKKQTKNQEKTNNKKYYARAAFFSAIFGILSLLGMLYLGGAGWLDSLITAVFCAGMMWLLVHDLMFHKYCASWYPTIGMLGTFVGIFIGLQGLDISDFATIVDNLSNLLDGLKLAFITSIVGVGLSGFRKILDYIGVNKIDTDVQETSLIELLSNGSNASLAISENTAQFKGGDIAGQIAALQAEFKQFSERAAENMGNQFANALGNIATDLNTKISEQFGGNLAKFADSVDVLVEWQKQNKADMDSYIDQLKAYADTYNEKLDKLTSAADSLEQIITRANAQIEILAGGLTAIQQLGKDAADAIPQVQSLVAEAKNTYEQVSTIPAVIESGLETANTDIQTKMQETAKRIAYEVTKAASDEMEKISDVATKNITGIETALEKLDNAVRNFYGGAGALGTLKGEMERLKANLRDGGNFLCGAMEKSAITVYEELNKYSETQANIERLLTKLTEQETAKAVQTTKKTKTSKQKQEA